MTYTRRRFLQGTAAVVAGNMARSAIVTDDPFLMLNRRQMDQPSRNQLFHSLRDDPRVQQLVQTAVDAALSAGATYADARLTFTQDMTVYQSPIPGRHETMGFGVRALVDGYWGFAASPVWNTVEAARLGRAATEQARVNVLGEPREIELAPIANTASGEWIMPVKDDPFEMAYDEIYDFLAGVGAFIRRLPLARTDLVRFDFQRQQKVFGSSSGQLTIQRLYRTGGVVAFSITTSENRTIPLALDCLTPAGAGFEYIREQPLRQLIVAKHEEGMKDLELPLRPIDVGRYPMLLDSYGAAHIVSQTIGRATEVDRAFGYEANAGGTSYITNPLEMLGSYRIGSSLVNISADRHSVGSVGRVKWDDEGVEPTPSQVVKGGVLAHMQTNREGAGWIKPYLLKKGEPFASMGCAYTPDAINAPLTHSADLTLQPGSDTTADLELLRKEMGKGVELSNPIISTDFQQTNGLGRGKCYEINGGKRTGILLNAGVMFRTTELWTNLVQLGGAASSRRYGISNQKGEPLQQSYHSVFSPPIIVKDMTFIDVTRKA